MGRTSAARALFQNPGTDGNRPVRKNDHEKKCSQKRVDRAGIEPAASSMPRNHEINPEQNPIEKPSKNQEDQAKEPSKKPEKEIEAKSETINDLWMKYSPPPTVQEMQAWLDGGKQTYKNEFADYMIKYKKKTAAPKKAVWYINALSRLPPMSKPADAMKAYADMGDHHIRAYRNFINYLHDMKEMDEVLGYSIDRWLDPVTAKQSQPDVKKDYTDDEVTAAYAHCPDDLKTFFKFLIYSGGRATQCKEVIDTWRPENLHISKYDERVAYYDAAEASSGTKNVYNLFIPATFVEELRAYKLPYSHIDSIYEKLRHETFSAKSTRKYSANLFADEEIDANIIDFIQGRTPKSVVAKNYFNLVKRGTQAYVKILDKFPI